MKCKPRGVILCGMFFALQQGRQLNLASVLGTNDKSVPFVKSKAIDSFTFLVFSRSMTSRA